MEFNYFYDKSGLSRDRLRFLWEFDVYDNNSSVVDSSSGSYIHSGTLGTKPDLYSTPGRALCGNSPIRVNQIGSVDQTQFTVLMDYSGIRNESEIIFSTFETGSFDYPVGFSLCKNHCNRLYVVAPTQDGALEIRNFSFNLANSNIIALRKANHSISLSCYDPYSESFESETIAFSYNTTVNIGTMFFAGGSGHAASQPEQPFSGTFNQIAFIDSSISDKELSGVFRGFRGYLSVPQSGQSVLYTTNNITYIPEGTDCSLVIPNTGHAAIFSGITNLIHSNLYDYSSADEYLLGITGSADGVSTEITGTLSGFVDGVLSFVSAYGDDMSAPSSYLASFTGDSSYRIDEYGDAFSTHSFNYDSLSGPSQNGEMTNSIFTKYESVESGSIVPDTGSFSYYKMDGASVVESNFTGNHLLREYNILLPNNFNLNPVYNFSQHQLYIPGGSGINLFKNRELTTNYSFTGEYLYLNPPIDTSNLFVYDREVSGSTYSLFTGANYVINRRLFRKSSVVHYEGNTNARLMLNRDYYETASTDLLHGKSIILTGSLTSIFTGVPGHWQ